MQTSFLQTTEWLNFQKSLGRKVWRFDNGVIRANIIRHDLPFKKSYIYIPHGPELNFDKIKSGVSNELKNFINHIKDGSKKERAIFIKMEPFYDTIPELLYQAGIKIKKSSKDIQPHKTVIMNLELIQEELLSRMHHKTRYNINLAEKKNLTFKESEDVRTFWNLLKKTAKTDNFSTHSFEYYKQLLEFFSAKSMHLGGSALGGKNDLETRLFLVEYESRPVAGAIIMQYEGTAYYLHGASDREYRNLMAPYLMHWEIIKKYKADGCHYYDFWGVDANKWPGVTRFKLSFGGDTVEHPGSFDLPISKIWYLIYKITRKIFH